MGSDQVDFGAYNAAGKQLGKAQELLSDHYMGQHTEDFNENCPGCAQQASVNIDTGEEQAEDLKFDPKWEEIPEYSEPEPSTPIDSFDDDTPENIDDLVDKLSGEDIEHHSEIFSRLAHKKYTAAEIINAKAAGPACDYVPGGRNARKGALSTCPNAATHFVFNQNLDPKVDEKGDYLYWDEKDPGHFVCNEHADDAVHDIDNDEINDVIDKNPGTLVKDLKDKLVNFGKKIPLQEIDESFIKNSRHKEKRFRIAYAINLGTYRAASFKGKGKNEGDFPLAERMENETPLEHLVRQAKTRREKALAADAKRQSLWRKRKKEGVPADPNNKGGRKIPQDEAGKTEVRTRDVSQVLKRAENILRAAGDPILLDEDATAEEKILRASVHAQSGLKFSGVDASQQMQVNPSGTRTPGIDERLINPADAVSPREPFRSYGVPPTEDVQGIMKTGAHVFSRIGPDRISILDDKRTDAPKFEASDGKIVDYVTGEEGHPGMQIINTDRGIVNNENPYSLTIKNHRQAGLITMWEGNVHYVHQVPHTEHFYKLLATHGLENIHKLPAEAFGRHLTDNQGNPRYLYVPSTVPVNFQAAEGTDASKLPELIKKEYAKAPTASSQQLFDTRLINRGEPIHLSEEQDAGGQAENLVKALRAMPRSRRTWDNSEKISEFLNGSDD